MKKTDNPYKNNSDSEWQLLGELDLSVNATANLTVNPWLMELLRPLELSTDFLGRVIESVQDSVMRTTLPNVLSANGHIYLSIFAPYERIPDRKTWGFFHIERIDHRAEAADARDHAIDFYLYVEGR